jgi:hypothetical protein
LRNEIGRTDTHFVFMGDGDAFDNMVAPLVSFDLVEARVSAGGAAVYAPANDEAAFAVAIDDLLDDPDRAQGHGRIRP